MTLTPLTNYCLRRVLCALLRAQIMHPATVKNAKGSLWSSGRKSTENLYSTTSIVTFLKYSSITCKSTDKNTEVNAQSILLKHYSEN